MPTTADVIPAWLAGRPHLSQQSIAVREKYSGEVVAHVATGTRSDFSEAIARAYSAREKAAAVPPDVRRDILSQCAARFEQDFESLSDLLCIEAGKPIRDARGEVTRLIDTFRLAAEEATRVTGEMLELQVSPRARGYRGMTRRFPVGVVAGIAPFNFPLNLTAHKIAPAIAAGCPFVIKPASSTPLGALAIGRALAETDWPSEAWSILPGSPAEAEPLVSDDRIALLSFTGSPAVGWELKQRCGRKRIVLELGGDAACLIEPDADLDRAVERLVFGAFYQSGQSCISVQRILAHGSIVDHLRDRLIAATQALVCGDPRDERTSIGPLIDLAAAERVQSWIEEAMAHGGRLLCGGRRHGAIIEPTLLEAVPTSAKLSCEEVFGPVAILSSYRDFEEALDRVNASRYGLQAGLFTRDFERIERAWERLEVGGLIVGDVPSWRVDSMPYGGVKESGMGREGVRHSIESMTESRLLVLRRPS